MKKFWIFKLKEVLILFLNKNNLLKTEAQNWEVSLTIIRAQGFPEIEQIRKSGKKISRIISLLERLLKIQNL